MLLNDKTKSLKFNQLLKAGVEVFYKKGIEHTTIDDIVKTAKCGKGTFYNYFKNKEAMLEMLELKFSEEMVERLDKAVKKDKSAKENLLAAIKEFIAIFHENKKLGRIIHERDTRATAISKRKNHQLASNNILIMRKYIVRIIEQNNLKEVEPVNLLSLLIGAAHFFLMREMKFGIKVTESNLEAVVDIILNGVSCR